MIKRYAKYLLILLIFTACSSQETEKYFTFPDNTWKRFENPLINLEITSTGIFYNLYVVAEYDVATAPDFIPISVISTTPDGEVRARNVRLHFKDGSGQARELLRKDFAFSEGGNCRFEIENRGQDIETIGIKRIGVVLEKID
jgi:hypothetical protein